MDHLENFKQIIRGRLQVLAMDGREASQRAELHPDFVDDFLADRLSVPDLGRLLGLADMLGISLHAPVSAEEEQAYATPEDRPIYRLLTGKDDRAFCERVSEALVQGWRLYGSPAMTYDSLEGITKVAQAVIWKNADVVKRD